ncbi:MAG TPA: hypothetical protein H9839_04220 [Candidatus Intestinimonas stercorigallinarum]|nr:hypothetical protein [Candidatus Intestinimonas stercorigallinarum]
MDARLPEHGHEPLRAARSGGDGLDALLAQVVHQLVDDGRHQGDIDAEGLLRQALALLDPLAHSSEVVDVEPGGVDAEGARLRDRRRERRIGDPRHGTADDGIFAA